MIAKIDGLPVFNALIGDDECGMTCISLVDAPAVMSDFLKFDKTKQMQMYSIANEDKRLVYGVVMRADFPIYRADKRMGEYFVVYTAETIRTMAEKYLCEARQNEVNLMHQSDLYVDGVQMVQYFIKDSSKGIAPAGFEDIADGSLFAEFHITNDQVWQAVKDGIFKGFSLEGTFILEPKKEETKQKRNSKMSKMNKIKELLSRVLLELGNVTTDKGILAWDSEDDLKAGDAVFVEDAEGNHISAEDGEYITSDKKTIVVVDGKVAEIKDPEAEVDSEPAPAPEAEAEPAQEAMSKIDTDKGGLEWNGEEDLKAGDEVFVEGNSAPDGEYVTADGKVIVVAEGKVAEIKDAEAEVAPEGNEEMDALQAENEALKAEIEELKKKCQKMAEQPLAKPAHEEMEVSNSMRETGNKGLDRLARILSAQ